MNKWHLNPNPALIITIMTEAYPELRLWQIMSPTFPVGMYSWSSGFEYAIDAGWVDCADKTVDWINQQLTLNLKYVDVPLLKRFYLAWQQQDSAALSYWSDYLYALRESKELLDEDRNLGQTLLRVLTELGLDQVQSWKNHARLSYLLMYACACNYWQIELSQALRAYVWSWVENQVSVAIKLVPIGHLAAQSVITSCMPAVIAAVEQGMELSDEEIGSGLPALAIASALHEKQYSRLFRS